MWGVQMPDSQEPGGTNRPSEVIRIDRMFAYPTASFATESQAVLNVSRESMSTCTQLFAG